MVQYFSQDGLEKLKKELEERETVIRPDIAGRIIEAKELGDLSENAEYAEAREAQGMNEGRIEELKDLIGHAVIIEPNQKQRTVVVGSTVSVRFNGNQKDFTIVGPAESDPARGFISNESPLGLAFMGKEKGEEVDVHIPSGTVKYKILEVT